MNLPSRPPHLNNEGDRSTMPTLWSPPNTRIGPPYTTPQPEEPIIQTDFVRELIGFPLRAVRRHRTIAISLFLLIAVAAALSTLLFPRHYIVQTKLVAAKNSVIPVLSNPRRALNSDSDTPTRLAVEAVMRRENLVEIIRETNLIAIQGQLRSPLGRMKAFVTERILGKKPTADDQMSTIVGLLQSRMWVRPEDQGTVTIGVDWPEPQSAYHIVQSAQQNFIEQRHASEMSMISDGISILQGHVTGAQQSMQEAFKALRAARPRVVANDVPVPPTASPRKAQVPAAQRAEIASVQSSLANKQKTISDLESSRNQTLAQLQTRLSDLRHTYGPAYPEVTATEDRIKALQQDSPQLVSLKSEVAGLQTRLNSLGGPLEDSAPDGSATVMDPAFARQIIDRLTRIRADTADSVQITQAQSRLKLAMNDYEDLLQRLEDANIELETARAGFKYRFNVVTPAEVPKKPSKPKVPLLILGGLFLGAMFGVFAATVLDFVGGRVVEKWQIQRQVGLPILATVPLDRWR